MIEQADFEIASFDVCTPNDSSLNLSYEEVEEVEACLWKELDKLGVREISHYTEFSVKINRDPYMTMDEQYQAVVSVLKRILKY